MTAPPWRQRLVKYLPFDSSIGDRPGEQRYLNYVAIRRNISWKLLMSVP